jgi:branched-subunit amino acid permease
VIGTCEFSRNVAHMIDTLGKIARALSILRLPTIAVGLACAGALVIIIFTSQSHEEDRYLIPSLVGVVWAIATYIFLGSFSAVPPKPTTSWSFFRRVRRHVVRAWYGVLAIVYFTTSGFALWITSRLLSIWIRDYFG